MAIIRNWRGVENLYAAEILKDTDESFETGVPFKIAGVAELSRSTENSSETVYYDNSPSIVVSSIGADTVTASVSAIDLDILAKLTGQKYDEELGMFIEGDRENKYFSIGYKTSRTDNTDVYVWRLKCSCSIPDQTNSTRTGGTESAGNELTFTGIMTTHKFAKTGAGARAVTVEPEKDKVDVSDWFTEVKTPDNIVAKA